MWRRGNSEIIAPAEITGLSPRYFQMVSNTSEGKPLTSMAESPVLPNAISAKRKSNPCRH
jgi:hypothetical protein